VSKLPVVSSNDLIKYLTKKGFVHRHSKGGHHIFVLDDIRVTIPERKEVGKGLLLSILAEVQIKREDFIMEWNS